MELGPSTAKLYAMGHFNVRVILIIEHTTVTLKCSTAIKARFLYFNLCLSVMLDRLSYSFTSMSFFINLLETKQIVSKVSSYSRIQTWELIRKNKDYHRYSIHIQYWCSDSKYRIYVVRLRNVPSHINSIVTINTPILYLSYNKICPQKMLFSLTIKKNR